MTSLPEAAVASCIAVNGDMTQSFRAVKFENNIFAGIFPRCLIAITLFYFRRLSEIGGCDGSRAANADDLAGSEGGRGVSVQPDCQTGEGPDRPDRDTLLSPAPIHTENRLKTPKLKL